MWQLNHLCLLSVSNFNVVNYGFISKQEQKKQKITLDSSELNKA